ncbi:MAG: HD domain-containing protein, partial [bacterium]
MYARTISIQDVITAYNKNHKLGNRKAILKAFRYADARHMGSKRGSGEPYINHPLRVARFVASWGFESDVVAAALLHDVVEDCDVPLSDIEKQFGSTTSQIVDAVTALSDRDFADHTLTKAQKDLLSDAKLQRKMNERALFVKIADRIDNLSTLDGVPEEKRIPKAEHTRDIIIPMAILEHAYRHVDT